jgi:acyl-CoA synthetase (NDP forming)
MPASNTLSEAASKQLLRAYGLVTPDERTAATPEAAASAATEIGFPVVLKLAGDRIAHKTERGLVRLALGDADTVREAGRSCSRRRRMTTATSRCSSPMVGGTAS